MKKFVFKTCCIFMVALVWTALRGEMTKAIVAYAVGATARKSGSAQPDQHSSHVRNRGHLSIVDLWPDEQPANRAKHVPSETESRLTSSSNDHGIQITPGPSRVHSDRDSRKTNGSSEGPQSGNPALKRAGQLLEDLSQMHQFATSALNAVGSHKGSGSDF